MRVKRRYEPGNPRLYIAPLSLLRFLELLKIHFYHDLNRFNIAINSENAYRSECKVFMTFAVCSLSTGPDLSFVILENKILNMNKKLFNPLNKS